MFDPNKVERYENSVYVTGPKDFDRKFIDTVAASDYDKLLALYHSADSLNQATVAYFAASAEFARRSS